MRRVIWAAAATNDVSGLKAYYADIDGGTAQVIVDRVVLATDWLLDWPHAGREIGETGYRKWKPRGAPHILIYRPVEDGIEIVRVRHERENWLADL